MDEFDSVEFVAVDIRGRAFEGGEEPTRYVLRGYGTIDAEPFRADLASVNKCADGLWLATVTGRHIDRKEDVQAYGETPQQAMTLALRACLLRMEKVKKEAEDVVRCFGSKCDAIANYLGSQ